MPYVIKFTDPAGAVSYWPKGFGHTCHEHARDLAGAERFDTEARASRSLYGYIAPSAFWESERRHRAAMIEQFRRWQCEVVRSTLTTAIRSRGQNALPHNHGARLFLQSA